MPGDMSGEFLGAVIGGFLGGALSAVLVELFRLRSRKERYAEVLYQQRLTAYGELSRLLFLFMVDRDVARLRQASRLIFLFPDAIFVRFRAIFSLTADKHFDEAVVKTRQLLRLLQIMLGFPRIEETHEAILRVERSLEEYFAEYPDEDPEQQKAQRKPDEPA